MKWNHLAEYFTVYALFEYVGFECSFGLFETEGDVVSSTDVTAVVEASLGAARGIPYLGLEVCVGVCVGVCVRLCGACDACDAVAEE